MNAINHLEALPLDHPVPPSIYGGFPAWSPPTRRPKPTTGTRKLVFSGQTAQTVYEARGVISPGSGLHNHKLLEIIDVIGEGGMGTIYRAHDPAVDRSVALKVLKSDVDQHDRDRFRREAATLARFSHPNLPRVFDRGDHAGVEWMTMEYLEGRDLGKIVDETGPVALPELIALLAQVLDALAYVHNRGVVHCDVKPNNIFVSQDSFDPQLVVSRLIDFGICRDLRVRMDCDAQIIGDPSYMAPEQATVHGSVSPSTDLYSLGLTFYEALVGEHPFWTPSTPLSELLRMQTHRPVPPPSLSLGDRYRRGHAAIDAFVVKACAKEPGVRFPNARAMKTAMLRLITLI